MGEVQPLMPDSVTPSTKRRRAIRKASISGKTMRVADAIIGPTSLPPSSDAKIEIERRGGALDAGDDEQRPEEVVPVHHDREHAERGDHGHQLRDEDEPQRVEFPGAVDAGGVDQVLRQRPEALAQQEDAEGAGRERHDQRGVAVEQVGLRDHEVDRDCGDLGRNQENREDDGEQQRLQAEILARQHVGRRHDGEYLKGEDRQRHDRAVDQERPDVSGRERLDVVGEVPMLGKEPQLRREDLVLLLDREAQHPGEGEQHDERAGCEHEMAEEGVEPHVVVTRNARADRGCASATA